VDNVEMEKGFRPDVVVDLDVGVPLRDPKDVSACLKLIEEKDFDGVVTVYEAERNPYFNMVEFDGDRIRLVKQPPAGITRRQDAPSVYGVSPSVFAFRRSRLDKVVHLFDGNWGGCIVPRERAVDIDTEMDFRFVEFLMTPQC
jgi:CMP-N,N'-diacetyllegionaminic acid synthase